MTPIEELEQTKRLLAVETDEREIAALNQLVFDLELYIKNHGNAWPMQNQEFYGDFIHQL